MKTISENSGAADRRYLILFAAFLAAVFAKVLALQTLISNGIDDNATNIFSFVSFIHRSVMTMQLPVWTRLLHNGFPIFAELPLATYYPVGFLLALLPAQLALNWGIVLHIAAGGIAVFLLLRRYGVQAAGCFLGALTYSASGFHLANNYGLVRGSTLMPFVFLMTDRLLEKRSPGRIFGLLLAVALQASAGYPSLTFHTIAICLAYSLWRSRRLGIKRSGVLAVWAGIVLLTGGLLAVQILPTWELIAQSPRLSWDVSKVTEGSMLPSYLLSFFLPSLFRLLPGQFGDAGSLFSIFGLSLAAVAAWRWRKEEERLSLFFLIVLAVAACFRMGKYFPPYSYLFSLPGLSFFRKPGDFSMDMLFVISVLAGLGYRAMLDSLAAGKAALWERAFLILAALSLLLPWLASIAVARLEPTLLAKGSAYVRSSILGKGVHPYPLNHYLGELQAQISSIKAAVSPLSPYVLSLAAGLFAAALIIGLFRRNRIGRNGLNAALAVVAALQIWAAIAATQIMPQYPMAEYMKKPPLASYLQKAPGDFNIFSWPSEIAAQRLQKHGQRSGDYRPMFWFQQHTLQPNLNADHEIRSIDGITSLWYERLERLRLHLTRSNTPLDERRRLFGFQSDSRLLGMLNVKYVVSAEGLASGRFRAVARDGAATAYENLDHVARLHLVSQATSVPDAETAWLKIMDSRFRPADEAVVEGGPGLRPTGTSEAAGKAAITEQSDTRVAVKTSSGMDTYLICEDSWYPDWRATVDGSEVPVLRANYVQRAVRLSPGKHTVVFRYESQPLRTGSLISLFSLALLIIGVLFRRRLEPLTSRLLG